MSGGKPTPYPDEMRIKVISMGEGGVGKSCLIKRYCEGKFVSRYISTIGVDFGVKPVDINGVHCKINFWDLSGHPEFFEIRNEFYKDTQGAMLVYDVGRRETFEKLEEWLTEARKYAAAGATGGGAGAGDFSCVVCANKTDKKRAVSTAEGKEWADDHGLRYFETSAQTGQNVDDMFDNLFKKVVAKTDRMTGMGGSGGGRRK